MLFYVDFFVIEGYPGGFFFVVFARVPIGQGLRLFNYFLQLSFNFPNNGTSPDDRSLQFFLVVSLLFEFIHVTSEFDR